MKVFVKQCVFFASCRHPLHTLSNMFCILAEKTDLIITYLIILKEIVKELVWQENAILTSLLANVIIYIHVLT